MNNVEMHTFVEKLSLENKKKNELFFVFRSLICIFLLCKKIPFARK